MLFLPFDAFGAYNQGKKEANAENWADIFNTEKATKLQRDNDMYAALFDSTVAAGQARNQSAVDTFPLLTADWLRKDQLGAAAQPGALARANSGSDMAVDYSAQLKPQIPAINANLVGAAVAGSGNQLGQQQGTARTQEMAAADSMWTQVAPQLAALQATPGNEVPLAAQIQRLDPGATVSTGADGRYHVTGAGGTWSMPLDNYAATRAQMFKGYYTQGAKGQETFHQDAAPRAAAKAGAAPAVSTGQVDSALGVAKPAAQPTAQAAAAPTPAAAAPAAPAAPADPLAVEKQYLQSHATNAFGMLTDDALRNIVATSQQPRIRAAAQQLLAARGGDDVTNMMAAALSGGF